MSDASGRLKWAREQAGFKTAAEAADALGIRGSTYWGHENSNRGFKSRAPFYARKFKVSLEWLLTGRGDPKRGQIQDVFDALPPELQREAENYIEYLRNRAG